MNLVSVTRLVPFSGKWFLDVIIAAIHQLIWCPLDRQLVAVLVQG